MKIVVNASCMLYFGKYDFICFCLKSTSCIPSKRPDRCWFCFEVETTCLDHII